MYKQTKLFIYAILLIAYSLVFSCSSKKPFIIVVSSGDKYLPNTEVVCFLWTSEGFDDLVCKEIKLTTDSKGMAFFDLELDVEYLDIIVKKQSYIPKVVRNVKNFNRKETINIQIHPKNLCEFEDTKNIYELKYVYNVQKESLQNVYLKDSLFGFFIQKGDNGYYINFDDSIVGYGQLDTPFFCNNSYNLGTKTNILELQGSEYSKIFLKNQRGVYSKILIINKPDEIFRNEESYLKFNIYFCFGNSLQDFCVNCSNLDNQSLLWDEKWR